MLATPYGTTAKTPPSTDTMVTATTGYAANIFWMTQNNNIGGGTVVVRGNISTSAWGTEKTNQGGKWNHMKTALIALGIAGGILVIGLVVDRSRHGR